MKKTNKLLGIVSQRPFAYFVEGVKMFICTIAIQPSALSILEQNCDVDIPIIKWFIDFFQNVNGWGIETIFVFAGIAAVLYIAHKHPLQHNILLSVLCGGVGICTVIGRSYEEIGSWGYIFNGKLQMAFSLLVATGYFLLYKNVIIFGTICLKKWNFSRVKSKNSLEAFLFEKHPLIGGGIVIAACSIPILIVFWPGTLQWDAYGQLQVYFGGNNWDGRFPIFVTWLSGKCIELGRTFFGSDSAGMFLYTFPQYVIQWGIFSYGIYILNKLDAPIIWRWLSLLYYSLFPAWRIWGFTMAKDTYYYLSVFLIVLLLIDIHISKIRKPVWWQWILLCISSLFCCLVRPNGVLLIICTMLGAFFLNKKQWKIYIICIVVSVLPTFALNEAGKIYWGIGDVPARESLSIPLQQTARYLQCHFEELTQEESDVLKSVFAANIDSLPYHPEISDGVKDVFRINASNDEVSAYLEIWLKQFFKHPETYLQALLNHTYGYFYPNREWLKNTYGTYYLGDSQHWQDSVMDIKFGMDYQEFRDYYRNIGEIFTRIPIISMLYSCGLQNYILIGCFSFLLYHKKKRELIILLPSVATIIMCIFSPVNACVRYMLPIMVLMPVNSAWCYYVAHTMPEQKDDEIGSRGKLENDIS